MSALDKCEIQTLTQHFVEFVCEMNGTIVNRRLFRLLREHVDVILKKVFFYVGKCNDYTYKFLYFATLTNSILFSQGGIFSVKHTPFLKV